MKRIIDRYLRPLKGYSLALFLLLAPVYTALAAETDNVHFFGTLIAEPCVIPSGQGEILLDFGTIIDKYLYTYKRTGGKRFELRLTECDLAIAKLVKVTFLGTESSALSGLLAVDASSQAQGIAIGLETLAAEPLPFNKASGKYPLQAGSNVIVMKAYIQGEPKAIAEKTIKRGSFSGTATFKLEYE
ncbi:fimbrial protein [Serratia silvae]|uniref:Fimbrial protein n=1 Tax=Serratia silvae TaxID=2824122 RepID=A0ABT0KI96_9GAMM|nr:fimbrial protein [Serratia silvae]MCL1031288.1 fimbrial protein [Serratia silvae]